MSQHFVVQITRPQYICDNQYLHSHVSKSYNSLWKWCQCNVPIFAYLSSELQLAQISISYLGGWVAARLMQVNQQIREPRSPGPMAPWPMVSRGRDVKSACTDNRSYMDCWDYTGWGTGLLSIMLLDGSIPWCLWFCKSLLSHLISFLLQPHCIHWHLICFS